MEFRLYISSKKALLTMVFHRVVLNHSLGCVGTEVCYGVLKCIGHPAIFRPGHNLGMAALRTAGASTTSTLVAQGSQNRLLARATGGCAALRTLFQERCIGRHPQQRSLDCWSRERAFPKSTDSNPTLPS
eukprot:s2129_g2.t3